MNASRKPLNGPLILIPIPSLTRTTAEASSALFAHADPYFLSSMFSLVQRTRYNRQQLPQAKPHLHPTLLSRPPARIARPPLKQETLKRPPTDPVKQWRA